MRKKKDEDTRMDKQADPIDVAHHAYCVGFADAVRAAESRLSQLQQENERLLRELGSPAPDAVPATAGSNEKA